MKPNAIKPPWALLLAIALLPPPAAVRGDEPSAASVLRRPAALALCDGDRWLLVAGRRSGTVGTLDTGARRVVAETPIGRQLSDLIALTDDRWLLAADEAAHEVLLLARENAQVRVAARLPVSAYPVSLSVAADGRRAYVASLWSRTVTAIEIAPPAAAGEPPALSIAATLRLPFAPREQLPLPDGRTLIVADSFGGRLVIVDAVDLRLLAVRELPAHNIRGLAVAGDKLLLAHQILNGLAETNDNDVHWGILMTNVLRWLPLDGALDPAIPILRGSHVHPAGDSNGAAGDPAGLAVTGDGAVLMTVGGVDELAIGRESDRTLRRVSVGRRPTAVVAAADGRTAYVANTLGDSISVVDIAALTAEEIPLGAQPELTAADRGELLFYDARLSMDSWFSCQSCHTDGHTNGLRTDNLGDGSFGAAKRVLTLLGSGDAGPWAWDGHVATLEAQVASSIATTMQGQPLGEEAIGDLAAFVRTLTAPPPLGPLQGDDPAAAARGEQVFAARRCADCHAPPNYTTPATYDVGTRDKLGLSQFNPPALRGVSQGGPYLHDGRAATLEEVFTIHRHPLDAEIPPADLADLIAFLRCL